MSVWDSPFYVLEQAHSLLPHISRKMLNSNILKQLLTWEVKKAETYDHEWPLGDVYGNIMNKSLDIKEKWPKSFTKRYLPLEMRLMELDHCKVEFGLSGMFKLIDNIWHVYEPLKQEFDWNKINKLAETAFLLGTIGNFVHANHSRQFLDALKDRLPELDKIDLLENWAYGIRHTQVMRGIESWKKLLKKARFNKLPLPELPRKELNLNRKLHFYKHANITILHDERQKRIWIMTNKDIERLARQLESIRHVVYYLANYENRGIMKNSRFFFSGFQIVKDIVTNGKRLSKNEVPYLCRAYDVLYNIYLAQLASDVNSRAVKEQMDKFTREGLNKLIDKNFLFSLVRGFSIKDTLELLKIYKMIQVPEYDQFIGVDRTRLLHRNQNQQIKPTLLGLPDWVGYEDFKLFQIHQFINVYYQMHERCPGKMKDVEEKPDWYYEYPRVNPSKIDYRDVVKIDLKGCIFMHERSMDYIDMLKDKLVCPDNIQSVKNQEELDSIPNIDRNYILKELRNPTDVEDDLKLLNKENADQQIAFKAEAKKPLDSVRCFFSARSKTRKAMAHVDEQIYRYLKHRIGNVSGVSSKSFSQIMQGITAFDQQRLYKLMISFDLKAFSPGFNENVKQDQLKFWSHLFGDNSIRNLFSAVNGSQQHFLKMGVNLHLKSEAADYEGQFGRMNTWYHVDVMAYAVTVLRSMKLTPFPGRFAAMIDDGILAISWPHKPEENKVHKALLVIEQIYEMAGLKISWDKTFVSFNVGVFLNDVYIRGHNVSSGIKAFLRSTMRPRVVTEPFVEAAGKLAGFASGAIKAGSSGLFVYYNYLRELGKLICSYDRKAQMDHKLMAAWMLSPIQLGGAGALPYVTILGSLSVGGIPEYIGLWRHIVRWFPGYKEFGEKLTQLDNLSQIEHRSLKNPDAVHISGPRLNPIRVYNALKENIGSYVNHPYIHFTLNAESEEVIDLLSNSFPDKGFKDSRGLQTLWEMTPLAYSDRLLQKVSSPNLVREIIGIPKFIRLCRSIRFEVHGVCTAFLNRMFV